MKNNEVKVENKNRLEIWIYRLIYMYVILNPILDIASYLTRNIFEINISPATILRPIIPICICIYIFFKNDLKYKMKMIGISVIYGLYTIVHLYLFSKNITGSSYGGLTHELQYMINYTFMFLNIYIFTYLFRKKEQIGILKKSVLISTIIYIVSICIAIITNTSSYTYMYEQIGYKGWFESGNSVSAILILSMFVYIPLIKNKKYIKVIIPLVVLTGIYLTMLIGTRTGMFGFFIVLGVIIVAQILLAIIKKVKIDKKIILVLLIVTILSSTLIGIIGSSTTKRREYIEDEKSDVHLTGDLTNMKNSIEQNTIEEGYLSNVQKQSILDLYNTANYMKIENTDQRMQQLIYNVHLIKNQKDIMLVLFGNGFVLNFRELIMEMEVPAILFNFGIIGTILYLGAFIYILGYGIILFFKNIKKIDDEYILVLSGLAMAFALSTLTGYVFFNISTMTIIVILATILMYNIRKIKEY